MQRPVYWIVLTAGCALSFLAGRLSHHHNATSLDSIEHRKNGDGARVEHAHSSPTPRVSHRSNSVANPESEEEKRLSPTERVRAAFSETNEFVRLQLFHRALAELTPEEAKSVHQEFLRNDKLGRYFLPEFAYFTRRWGEVDGPTALAFAQKEWGNNSRMKPVIGQMVAGWATHDPNAAVEWINTSTSLTPWFADTSLEGLVKGLAYRDLDQATAFVESRLDDNSLDQYLNTIAETFVYTRSLEDAKSWFESTQQKLPVAARQSVFRHLMTMASRGDNNIVAQSIKQYCQEPWFDHSLSKDIAREFLRRDPTIGKALAESLPEGVPIKMILSEGSPPTK